MNPYLSREEKEHFVRATALAALLEITIYGYAHAKSTDPDFLKYLRMGRTMVQKALTMRADALEPEAKNEFHKQTGRLEFICVPKLEAKKAHEELMALKTTMPMETQDFQDWYEAVIETTCKTCQLEDFTTCQIRRVLTKYGVYPIDPEAKRKCQYSYVGTAESERPGLETDANQVSAEKYNLAVAEYSVLETKVREEYMPEIETLRQKIEQLESAAASEVSDQSDFDAPEQNDGMIPVTLGLSSGNKLVLDLPAHMANNLLNELKRPDCNTRALCACHVEKELVAIDMQEVVTMQVSGLEDDAWVRPQPQPYPSRPANPAEYEDNGERERYQVECKCGAEYVCSMNVGRTRARCRECNSMVFADRQAEVFNDATSATLLTNRYWVEREEMNQ